MWRTAACCGFALLIAALGAVAVNAANPDFQRIVQLALKRYGAGAAETARQWETLVQSGRGLPEIEKLQAVNAFFNGNVRFEDDSVVWGVADYWATPLETLGRGQGDCEDFSIGKYVTLGLLGVPLDRLRITYVRAQLGLPGRGAVLAHMVLAYYPAPEADPLILDNLVPELLPASQRPDLRPVFGFNSEGLWVAGRKISGGKDPTARLSRWRNLLRRLEREGLN